MPTHGDHSGGFRGGFVPVQSVSFLSRAGSGLEWVLFPRALYFFLLYDLPSPASPGGFCC